jgi:uncharacterized repeat protein (TIGR01451 family)
MTWTYIADASRTATLGFWSYTNWLTTNLFQGIYIVRAIATDNQNNTTVSTDQPITYPAGVYALFTNTCGLPAADVAIIKTGPANAFAGTNVTYTISVTNKGPSVATNVIVSDALQTGVTFVSASGGGALSNRVVYWPGFNLSYRSFTNYTLTVTAPAEGTLTNRASSLECLCARLFAAGCYFCGGIWRRAYDQPSGLLACDHQNDQWPSH